MSRLLKQYNSKILKQLKDELEVDNVMAVPRIEKIVVSAGLGKRLQEDPKSLDKYREILAKITGQNPAVRRAAKSIAGFKVREGQVVGLSATLRGKRMYDFLDRLINTAFPRTRDFRGVSKKGFDGRGNYNLGLREQIVFPESAGEKGEISMGLEVTIVTNTGSDEQAYQLLKKFGFPFKD